MTIGRYAMQGSESDTAALTPDESWGAIHTTMDRARSSMYVAGTATILLLWGAIVALGYFGQYAIETLASEFATGSPWYPGPLWGVLAAAGMVGSARIGHRAGGEYAVGDAARSAGIRVFLFWLAVVSAAFLVPAAAGLWTADDAGTAIPRVVVGIVALGLVLFGIMHRPAIAAVGVGFAAAFYLPSYLAGDAALLVTAAATLVVVALGAAWIRRSGVPLTDEATVLNETIHQATRLRIMTLLVMQPETDRLAYGFIQRTLGLTGGNLTIHLRKLEDADYLVLTKEFVGVKPRTWVQAAAVGRRAFAEYLVDLERALNGQLHR